MGLIWLAAVVAAASKSQRHKRGHSSSKSNHSTKSSSKRNYDPEHTFYDCVIADVYQENSKLHELFQLLYDEYQKELDGEYHSLRERKNQLKSELSEATSSYDKTQKFLSKRGVSFVHSFNPTNYDSDPCLLIGEEVRIDLRGEVDVFQTIDEYLATYSQNLANYRSMEASLEAKIDKLQEEYNCCFYRKAEIMDEISVLKEKLRELREKIFSLREKKVSLQVLSNLTDEQKQQLLSGIEENKNTTDLRQRISKLEYEIQQFYYRYISCSNFNEDIMARVFEKLIVDDKISQADLEQYFLLLDKVEIRGRRGEYSLEYGVSNSSRLMVGIVKWFVDHVYEMDPDFVRRNYDLDQNRDEVEEDKSSEKPVQKIK